MRNISRILAGTVAACLLALTPAAASISITAAGTTVGFDYAVGGEAYTQNFDVLPASGTFTWANDTTLPGWYASDSTGGLNTTGKTINGTATNPDDLTLSSIGAVSSSERALAYHTRLASAPAYLGLAFVNNTGQTLNAFSLTYTAEQWKEGTDIRTVTVTVEYKVGATLADLHATTGWTTLPGLGFSTSNGSAPNSTSLSASNIAVSIPPGSSLWIRWVFTNNATSSTTSHDILAVDNVTFSAAASSADFAPVITSNPVSQTVFVGAPATFSVTASGQPAPTYQWFKGVSLIQGATASSYTIDSVTADHAGDYSVMVTNSVHSVTSGTATLTVGSGSVSQPTIISSPVPMTRMIGGGATFSATFSGTGPFTYKWYKNDMLIPAATGEKLTLTGLTASDAGVYRVTATNALGTASSAPSTLAITARLPDSTFNLTGFAAQPIYPGVPSNTFSPATTTGGGVIPETDPAYRKVSTPMEFALAIGAANKGQNVKVIEIMNDLDLGWNEIGTAVQTVTNTPFAAALPAQLHPKLLVTGVSSITINPKNGGLTIFSANGSAIRHCIWGVKSTANIIIRNLKFDELWEWDEASPKPGDYDKNNWDFINLSVGGGTVDHVWIDHCTFTKSYDGIVDNKGGVSNVTHSWNRYEGDDSATNSNSFVRQQINRLEANKSAYPMYDFLRTHGFSVEDIVQILQGPDKTTAIGELSLKPENANASITFHHQWYLNAWDRLPRLAGGTAHNYNIYVDDTLVQQAKRLRDARYNAMNAADRATFTTKYNFNPPINGSISTEDGALLVEKSVYIDCNWPLRNNQTNPSNPIYTGKIKATDTIYIFHNTDGTTTTVRGDSTDPGNPLGPKQATIKPFSWNTPDGSAPYTLPPSAYHDPSILGEIVAAGAGAGVLTWDKSNWLKTSYTDAAQPPLITTQPLSQTVTPGSSVTFTVVATGTGTLTYQWRKGTSPISGATGASYAIASAQVPADGDYNVVVSDANGSATSRSAILAVRDTFAAWSARHGITGSDSDRDGIDDLLEFALGLNPLQPSIAGLPRLSDEAGQRVFRFTRPKNLSGLTYTVQTSTSLSVWDGTLEAVVESSTTTTETLIAIVPQNQPKLYIRLRINP